MCIEMFGDDLEPVKSVIPYRGFKLWLTVTFLRRVISKETWGHGIGRHSKEDIWDIAVRDMDSISHFLGTLSQNLFPFHLVKKRIKMSRSSVKELLDTLGKKCRPNSVSAVRTG